MEKGRDKQEEEIEKRRYKERKKWIGKDGERKRWRKEYTEIRKRWKRKIKIKKEIEKERDKEGKRLRKRKEDMEKEKTKRKSWRVEEKEKG